MKILIIFVILCVHILDVTSYRRKCGKHEVYKECGFACVKTCATKDLQFRCVADCVKGCFCVDGYIRLRKNDKCVKLEDCPKCGINETYSTSGTDCPKCSNYKFVRCAQQNVTGCYCNPGYVREDYSERCVLTEDCPQEQCQKENEEYTPCDPGPCQETCQNRDKQIACPELCRIHGCKCSSGFIRDEISGRCILEENCPKEKCLKRNEEFAMCAPGACERTCNNKDESLVCTDICLPSGCACKLGFVRDISTGDCIKEDKCP